MLSLVKAVEPQGADEILLDARQREVLDATDRVLEVLGAPGTGKTTLALEIVAMAVADGLQPDECVLLSPTRVGAGELRARVTSRIGGTSTEPIARTPQALAFGILRARASLAGMPAPRLISGPEQDVVLKELLAGHARGLGSPPAWPQDLAEAVSTRGFRNELRDLLMRAVEWGVGPQALADLGRSHGRPEWAASATMLEEYDEVTALSRPGAFDPAWILGGAAAALHDDPELLARYQQQFKLIVIDDAQELTRAAVTFLGELVGAGQRLVLIGDPDVTVQGFRGADPRFMGEVSAAAGGARRITLSTQHRLPDRLNSVREEVTARVGTVLGVEHRQSESRPGGEVGVALLRSAAQEAAHIAGVLRRAHLLENVPWKDMAVIVRGSGGSAALRRALNAAQVPVAVPPASLALRDEPAVRPFLTALDVLTSDAAATGTLPLDTVMDLLTSPLGNADPVTVRRLRRSLRRDELAAGGHRSSDELLEACLFETALLDSNEPALHPVRRVARVLAAGAASLERPAPHNEAEHVLWAMWQASGLADPWEASALGGGVLGTRADRDLDAMLALFSAAAMYADRLPGAGARDFLDHLREQDVPGDRLVAAAPDDDAVALLTPAGAAGREWHTVVVAHVQDGVWPDLRLRGSVLGSEALVDALSGRGGSLRARQAAVRHDETRQFVVAVTRARQRLLVTAVRDEDEQPSVYLDIVDPLSSYDGQEVLRPFTEVAPATTLAGAVAQARRMLVSDDPEARDEAADRLALLARAGVPGADPDQWWALVNMSEDRPLRRPDQTVRISPSKVESYHDCGLNWFLTGSGGSGPSIGAATLGSLIHEIAEEFADTDPGAMLPALEERWARLGLGTSWVSVADFERAKQMITKLQTYLGRSADEGWHGVGAEVRFGAEVPTAKAMISGVVDRLEKHATKGLRVVDYKTGSSKPRQADIPSNAQLAAYQLAVEQAAFRHQGSRSGGAALVQLGGDTRKPGVQVQDALGEGDIETPGSRAWAIDLMERTAEGMRGSTFTASITDRCKVCPVRSSCPLQPEGRTLT